MTGKFGECNDEIGGVSTIAWDVPGGEHCASKPPMGTNPLSFSGEAIDTRSWVDTGVVGPSLLRLTSARRDSKNG